MSIKQWFRNWLMSNDVALTPDLVRANRVTEEDALLTFNIIKATNGYIVKSSQYKPVKMGNDWTHELYIVKDDEKIPDVIARIMAINALEK
jgi:hypothetical protein